MTTLMEHPDGDFSVQYERENELLWVSFDQNHVSIQLTALGLIDLGQRLVKEGVAMLMDDTE